MQAVMDDSVLGLTPHRFLHYVKKLRRLSSDKLWSSSCMPRILKYMLVCTLI